MLLSDFLRDSYDRNICIACFARMYRHHLKVPLQREGAQWINYYRSQTPGALRLGYSLFTTPVRRHAPQRRRSLISDLCSARKLCILAYQRASKRKISFSLFEQFLHVYYVFWSSSPIIPPHSSSRSSPITSPSQLHKLFIFFNHCVQLALPVWAWV